MQTCLPRPAVLELLVPSLDDENEIDEDILESV